MDTNVHYPPQVPANYYQPPQKQQQAETNYYQVPQQPETNYYQAPQQTEINNYPPQWSQQPTQPDLSNSSSQLSSINTSFYQPPADQTPYIQPGFTSTPNPYPSQQPQQQWHPSGQNEQRDRLPSNEVCKIIYHKQ